MEIAEVESRIKAIVPESEIEVEGAECDFSVTIVSEAFNGLPLMKRQQMILGEFTELLASGALHALTIKAYTLDEWNNKSSHLVQISL
ncbi:MAG: BolA/IbaG family iron-sulfur metabolism protein [Pseudomonadales bacterium]|nr:BolA/IbaG family iron-sulfur metabolism protein [Pseudomonadales bacterium]